MLKPWTKILPFIAIEKVAKKFSRVGFNGVHCVCLDKGVYIDEDSPFNWNKLYPYFMIKSLGRSSKPTTSVLHFQSAEPTPYAEIMEGVYIRTEETK